MVLGLREKGVKIQPLSFNLNSYLIYLKDDRYVDSKITHKFQCQKLLAAVAGFKSQSPSSQDTVIFVVYQPRSE